MRRKNTVPETMGVDEEIMRRAKQSLRSELGRPAPQCVICQGDAAPNSTENLCWVCRRLKISAWRESEQQVSLQE
ncbi:MAG: hypothetical protein ACRD7E_05920 [Bryobacteraceae bacterium]